MQAMMIFFSLLSNPTGWLSSWQSSLAEGHPRFNKQSAPSLQNLIFSLEWYETNQPACDEYAKLNIVEASDTEKDWGRGQLKAVHDCESLWIENVD